MHFLDGRWASQKPERSGLYDLIGLDLMADVVRSLRSILPEDDPFHLVGSENELINRQVENGFTGNKGKGGFYREKDGAQFALDLKTGEWRTRKEQLPSLANEKNITRAVGWRQRFAPFLLACSGAYFVLFS